VIAGVSLKGGVGKVEMVALGALFLLILTNAMDLLTIDRAFRRSSLASSSSSRSHSTSFRRGGRSVSDVDVALRARETGAAGALWRSLLAVLLPI